MTKAELIKLIGDVLRQLDRLKTDPAPEDSTRPALADLRVRLAKQQLMLAISDLDEKAPAFLRAIEGIPNFDGNLQEALGSAPDRVALVHNFTSFAKAVDALVESRR